MARKNQLTTSDWLKYEEYERLLACLRKDKEYFWELYASLGFCTACRASDILHFRWRDLLNKEYFIVVEQKTKKARKLPFNESVQKKIREMYRLLDNPDIEGYVFKNRHTDRPVTIQYVNRMLKEFKDRYKIKVGNFSTHTFRKTFGRYVYERNNKSAESLILLNKILQHSSIEVTKAYIGITQGEIDGIFGSIVL